MIYSAIKHTGFRARRLKHESSFPECVFAEKWDEENKRSPGIKGGFGILELLLDKKLRTVETVFHSPPPITQRDAFVAATVVQWLGTNCGKWFLEECEKKINKINKRHKEEMEAWHKKHNLHESTSITIGGEGAGK